MSLRLLAIGLDETLAQSPERVEGDSHQRQLKYATVVDRYDLIVRTLRYHQGWLAARHLAPNFQVHPTNSVGKVAFVGDAVRIGRRILQEKGGDVISAQDPFLTGLAGYLLKRRYGLPLSLQFAGDMLDNPYWLQEHRTHRCLNRLGHWLIRRADTFRVVSVKEADKLKALGIPPERIWNLGWITDFTRFQTASGAAIRQAYLQPGQRRLVLFVGRFVPQKALPTLLEAIPLVLQGCSDVLFLLVGSGPEQIKCQEWVTERGLNHHVTFAGPVSYARIPAYFAACDVFVLPSLYEGNARVLAEAAAAGKPVVTTDVSGARDTVQNGQTGYIVPPGQPAALAERLSLLLRDPELAAAMGQRARSFVRDRYNERQLLRGFHDLWEATARCRVRGT